MRLTVEISRLSNSTGAVIAVTVALFTVVGCGRFIPSQSGSSDLNSNSAVSNTANTNSPSSFDSGKYGELLSKRSELAKLTPPVKLEPNAAIKGKVIVVSSNLEKIGDEDKLDNGFADYRLAKSIDEVGTVIQVLCSKGRPTATYVGKFNKRVKGFASECKVSIIDYKSPTVIAQKNFSNTKPPEVIASIEADTKDEYMMPRPYGAIVDYIDSFQVDKEIQNDGLLSEKELLRLPVKTALDPAAAIKGKIMIAQRTPSGEIGPLYMSTAFANNSSFYEINYEKLTTRSSELAAFVKIACAPGARIGKVGNTTEFANKCDVSIVDYKTMTVLAQKTFENKTLDQDARKEDYPLDWVVKFPEKEIGEYLKGFPMS